MIPERDVMVCASVTQLRNPIPGSQLRRCEQCNDAIWVAPKCEDLVLEQNLMRCCSSCAFEHAWHGCKDVNFYTSGKTECVTCGMAYCEDCVAILEGKTRSELAYEVLA